MQRGVAVLILHFCCIRPFLSNGQRDWIRHLVLESHVEERQPPFSKQRASMEPTWVRLSPCGSILHPFPRLLTWSWCGGLSEWIAKLLLHKRVIFAPFPPLKKDRNIQGCALPKILSAHPSNFHHPGPTIGACRRCTTCCTKQRESVKKICNFF